MWFVLGSPMQDRYRHDTKRHIRHERRRQSHRLALSGHGGGAFTPVRGADPYVPTVRLLFVCTGNACRSPLAERLLAGWAAGAGRADLQVSSAGLAATPGAPMEAKAAEALRRLGGDPTGFAARSFSAPLAQDADLVLTMTRKQRTQVLTATPRGLRRTFTLLEAAALLEFADLAALPNGPELARELGLRLDAARGLRATTETDDVPDPIGQSGAVHRQVAGRIADALRTLTDVLLGAPLAHATAGAQGELPARAIAAQYA
jgi:protein-tyrosine phosphatase